MPVCHRQIILCCMAFVVGCSEPEAPAAREFPHAADEYRQALLAAANRPESMANLAEFESRTGNTSAAARYFDLAIALGPGNAAIHHAYGLFLIRINRRDGALEELRQSLSQ